MTLILIVPACAAALAYGIWYCHQPPTPMRSVIKTASVALLALQSVALGAPWELGVALTLSATGDYFLSRSGPRAFLAGLVAFALAHLVYIVLFTGMATTAPPVWLIALVVLVALSCELWLHPYTGALRWPVRAYVGLIAIMAVAALALPPDRIAIQVGALAFMASDTLLAVQIFRLSPTSRAHRVISPLLWGLYWGAQVLIAWGVLGRGF